MINPIRQRHCRLFAKVSSKNGRNSKRDAIFNVTKLFSLIQLSEKDKWLFAGVYAVEGYNALIKGDPTIFFPNGLPRDYFKYSTRELDALEHLIGTTIIRFEKNFRACYILGDKYCER